MNQARILVVDDHPMVRRGLSDLINAEPDMAVCGEAENMASALASIEQLMPDLALVDLRLQEESGMDLIAQISARFTSIKILVCSMYEESIFAERAVRAGATGYVSKHEPGSTVLSAIREVLAGRLFISGELKDEIVRRLLASPATPGKADSPLHALSDREMQVFEMIGRGQSIREIAEHLHLSPRTVETYRDGIKNKLNLESSRDVVRYAAQWTMGQG